MRASNDVRGLPFHGMPWALPRTVAAPSTNAVAPGSTCAPASGTADAGPVEQVARWTADHLGTIGSIVGIASLVAAVPLARGGGAGAAVAGAAAQQTLRSRFVAQVARTSLGSSSIEAANVGAAALRSKVAALPGATSTAAAARRGWDGLRSARQAFGDTPAGRAVLRMQAPVRVAGAVVGGASLVKDADDWRNGRGSISSTVLHTIAVLPAAGEVVKRVARARAASTEAAAATRVAGVLDDALDSTASAIASADDVAVPQPIRAALDDVESALGDVSATATRRAASVADQARVLRPAADAALPTGRTFAVGRLREQVAAAERTAERALDAAAVTSAPTAGVQRQLSTALDQTASARRTLEAAEVHAGRLTSTARSAERVQDVAKRTSATAGIANNSIVLGRTDKSSQVHRSAAGLLTTGLSLLLARNGRATVTGEPA